MNRTEGRAMIPSSVIEENHADLFEGMRHIIIRFLNLAMKLGALERAGAGGYEHSESRTAHRTAVHRWIH